MGNLNKKIILVVVTVVSTILLIYLTPLKNLNLVEPKIDDIDPTAFHDAYAKNPDDYIFIDVRPEGAYRQFHAAGSINIPLHILYDERHVLPKRGKTIAIICTGGRASGVAYSYLEHYGFLNLKRIDGGIENWQLQGLPVEGTAIVTTVAPDMYAYAYPQDCPA